MPTIRIAPDVFEGLQKLAEPLVDTPNAVIRKLLIEKGLLQKPSFKLKSPALLRPAERALTPNLTPQKNYEQFLLVTLAQEFGGRGDKRSVTRAVIGKMAKLGFIGSAELELVATGETRAENTITWGRNALKNRGLIARGTRRGIWELTQEGIAATIDATLPVAPKR